MAIATSSKPKGASNQQKSKQQPQQAVVNDAVDQPAKVNNSEQKESNAKTFQVSKEQDQPAHQKQQEDANNKNAKPVTVSPMDVACNYDSLRAIIDDLDSKIANLEKKMQVKQSKPDDLKGAANNNGGKLTASTTELDFGVSIEGDESASGAADDGGSPVAINPNKSDPNYRHLESLRNLKVDIEASIANMKKHKETALRMTRIETMKRYQEDINRLKWLFTIQDTLKHLDANAKKELLATVDEDNCEKKPVLTPKQLEFVEKSVCLISPSRIIYNSKFSVQLDTSSKFIMHLYEGKKKEALPGVNFRNLKELLNKISDLPYFSDRQRHDRTENNSPDSELAGNVSPVQPDEKETSASRPVEQKPKEDNNVRGAPQNGDVGEENFEDNQNQYNVQEINKETDIDENTEPPKSLSPDDTGDNIIVIDQPRNSARSSHGNRQGKVYENSRGRSSRGGGPRYDRRKNYYQNDKKDYSYRGPGNNGTDRHGSINQRQIHNSTHQYRNSSQKNLEYTDQVAQRQSQNGRQSLNGAYPSMQPVDFSLCDPAVIAASLGSQENNYVKSQDKINSHNSGNNFNSKGAKQYSSKY